LKRLTTITLLMVALIALTACAPKIEEINAVVNSFVEHWKAGNAAKMAALMTDEVEYGMFFSGDAAPASFSSPPASKSMPASQLADTLASSPMAATVSCTITKTETFGDYAIVTCSFVDSASPDETIKFDFHLVKTDDGWKISLFAVTLLSID